MMILHIIFEVSIIKLKNVRSRISSKLIFASCGGYFDRAYYSYGFYVTSSKMFSPI